MPNDRIQKALDLILEDARLATIECDWDTVRVRAAMATALDPGNEEAKRFAVLASRGGDSASASTPVTTYSAISASARLADAVDRVSELRPFSAVAGRVIEALDDDSVSAADLARIIATEPALTTKLLRVANSAYYLRTSRVSSVQEAVTLLGSREVGSLALAACVTSALPEGHVVSYHDFWRFSLCVATLANVLERSSGARPVQAFTAGIVHNIGLLALDLYSPDGLREALALRMPGLRRLHDRERHVFGFTDAQLGAGLAHRGAANHDRAFPKAFVTGGGASAAACWRCVQTCRAPSTWRRDRLRTCIRFALAAAAYSWLPLASCLPPPLPPSPRRPEPGA